MEEYTFLAPLLLTIGGLIIGAILKSLLKHSRLPYTVGLFAIGILVGVLNRTGVFQSMPELHSAVNSVANINPDLILYLFLPILILMRPTNSTCISSRRPWPTPPCWLLRDSSSACC